MAPVQPVLPPAPSAGPSDALLVAAAQRGDLVAWERLVRRHQETAYQVAYLITRVTPLAEAATSAAFIRAYRALRSLPEGAELRPWLLRIVTGEARHRRREAARVRNTSREDVVIVSPRMPAGRLPAYERVAALSPLQREEAVTAFERLPEDDRLLIAARYHLAMSAADAATVSGIPEALTDVRLRQALTTLRSRLGDA